MAKTNDSSIVTKGILRYFYEKIKSLNEQLLDKKVDKVDGKSLSTNDFTNDDKTKLDSLSNYELLQATTTTLGGVYVDDSLSETSENPVQNKVIYSKVSDMQTDIEKLRARTDNYVWDFDYIDGVLATVDDFETLKSAYQSGATCYASITGYPNADGEILLWLNYIDTENENYGFSTDVIIVDTQYTMAISNGSLLVEKNSSGGSESLYKGSYVDDIDELKEIGFYQVISATGGTMPTINGTSVTTASSFCTLVVFNPWANRQDYAVQMLYVGGATNYSRLCFTRTYNTDKGAYNSWTKSSSTFYGSSSTGYNSIPWVDGDIYVQYDV